VNGSAFVLYSAVNGRSLGRRPEGADTEDDPIGGLEWSRRVSWPDSNSSVRVLIVLRIELGELGELGLGGVSGEGEGTE
jgi:hypothetical protein